MFLIFLPLIWLAEAVIIGLSILMQAVVQIVIVVLKIVVSVARAVANQVKRALDHYATFYQRYNHPVWRAIIKRRLDWHMALTHTSDFEKKMAELEDEYNHDKDLNGIPDLYDEEVRNQADDFLHWKFPSLVMSGTDHFFENDYVAYKPRIVSDTFQPVSPGSKGLVRSETVDNLGQHCLVKWNQGHIRTRVNGMDLFYLGHVHR